MDLSVFGSPFVPKSVEDLKAALTERGINLQGEKSPSYLFEELRVGRCAFAITIVGKLIRVVASALIIAFPPGDNKNFWREYGKWVRGADGRPVFKERKYPFTGEGINLVVNETPVAAAFRGLEEELDMGEENVNDWAQIGPPDGIKMIQKSLSAGMDTGYILFPFAIQLGTNPTSAEMPAWLSKTPPPDEVWRVDGDRSKARVLCFRLEHFPENWEDKLNIV